jgi:type I restriction enzyme, S subunit
MRGQHWSSTRLTDVCEEMTVGHVGPMADKYVAEGIPFLRSQNVEPFRLQLEDIKFIDAEFDRKLKKSRLRSGDVIIVRTG